MIEQVAAVPSGVSRENLQIVSPGSLSLTSTPSQIRGGLNAGKVKDVTLTPSLPPLSLEASFQSRICRKLMLLQDIFKSCHSQKIVS